MAECRGHPPPESPASSHARPCRASCAAAECRGSYQPQLRSSGTAAFQPQPPSQPSQWERTDQSRPKNPPDGTAVSRLKASVPSPLSANRTAPASLCSVLRPKGGATGKESSDGSHPARPKQKQTVCPHQDKPQALVGSDAPRQAVKLLKAKCTMHKA